MKYIAVFLMLNVLLLSSISGMANIRFGKAACCKQMTKQDCGKESKHATDDNCVKGNCNAMLCCGSCAFVVISSVSPSSAITDPSNQITHPFITGELSDYHGIDWNPPKD